MWPLHQKFCCRIMTCACSHSPWTQTELVAHHGGPLALRWRFWAEGNDEMEVKEREREREGEREGE